ncbi:unnamed protein product [Adineta ricciae]|uniref:Complexin n=1 Tax=Adineta ricciae TaxID=249248 RepID=A0A815YB18_ADIRI|nr:unnamed protein product [Adineta ricciae]CAF1567538.1 unnamed protein product [Adineta ricciae]
MSSYIFKTVVGNEINQVVKEFGFGNDSKEDTDVASGMSASEILAEEKKQKAEAEERRARHAKIEQERVEARQKIRDKYNIKKKDEPTSTHKSAPAPVVRAPSPLPPVTQNQGFDPIKMTSNAFNSLKVKFGWK